LVLVNLLLRMLAQMPTVTIRSVEADRVVFVVAHHGQRRAGVHHRAHDLQCLKDLRTTVDEVADEDPCRSGWR
jgi:hypothetical protein